MPKIYLSHNNIISSLGFSSEGVADAIKKEKTGLQPIHNEAWLPQPFYASMVSLEEIDNVFKKIGEPSQFTKLEKLMLLALQPVIDKASLSLNDRVGLIISTTKGNIDVLEKENPFPKERAYLATLGKTLSKFYGFATEPIILSNACVSGIMAVSIAKRYIEANTYDHVFIVAGDCVSKFILSGFNSFQALSDTMCKPFSKDRDGINIGEVGAAVLVKKNDENLPKETVEILGSATCNDANHISGPSRTGEGLYRAITKTMKASKTHAEEIDYVSAHGTATLFNDEMEAIAFNRAGLEKTPLNSLKGYFGHTLGASGLLETIVGMHSLKQNTLFASLGFKTLGVSKPINVIKKTEEKNLRTFLKTSSGFGGCNTAAIFKKVNL